jgi:hypothetical protein
MKHPVLTLVVALFFSSTLHSASVLRDKYGFPPQWKVGDTWEVKSPSIAWEGAGMTTFDEQGKPIQKTSEWEQTGWYLTRFTVTGIEEQEGVKLYHVDAEQPAIADYEPPYPPGTRFLLTIDENFILRSVTRISPTEEESRRIGKSKGQFAPGLFGVGQPKTVEVYKAPYPVGAVESIGSPLVFPMIANSSVKEDEATDVVADMMAWGHPVHYLVSPLEDGRSGFKVEFSVGRGGTQEKYSLTWVRGNPWWSSIDYRQGRGYRCVSTLER